MALWKESTAPAKEAPPIMTPPAEPALKKEPDHTVDIAPQVPVIRVECNFLSGPPSAGTT